MGLMLMVRVGLIALLAVGIFAPHASGHYKFPGMADDPSGAFWFFTGVTYDGRPLDQSTMKDPVNFIFYDPNDGTLYTRDRIEQHMKDDWSTRAVGGRRWRRDEETIGRCKGDHYLGWRSEAGAETSDRTDWHGNTGALPGGQVCGSQHHARFWDDLEHYRQVPAHGPTGQWAVGGIHHERVLGPSVDPVRLVGHAPDRDWDRVRVEMVKAMRTHCSVRRWKYHLQADNLWQGYTNSGYIARFSLKHRASGCD